MLAVLGQDLRRPLVLWSMLAAAALAVALGGGSEAYANLQVRILARDLERYEDPALRPGHCAASNLAEGPECDALLRGQVQALRDDLAAIQRRYRLARAAGDPVAAGGVAAGLAASVTGLAMLMVVAAGHVAGEWTQGTVKVILANDPRRTRFVLAKFAGVFATGLGLILATWAGLLAAGPLFRRMYPFLPPLPRGFSAWSYTGSQIGRAAVVLAAFAALATLAAVVARNLLGTLGVASGLAGLLLGAGVSPVAAKASLGYWVASWMRFRPAGFLLDHVWPEGFPLLSPKPVRAVPWIGFLGLTATILASLLLAALRMRAADVGGVGVGGYFTATGFTGLPRPRSNGSGEAASRKA
jgi:ABC-type transport system involved in multi-copper enzyme maturation permease subunit